MVKGNAYSHFGILLICGACCCSLGVARRYSVTYTTPAWFPLRSDAHLECQVSPMPALNDFSMTWQKISSQKSDNIGVSWANQSKSFIYSTAPASLKGRFSMSSAGFKDGLAVATIAGVRVTDQGMYGCDLTVESERSSKHSPFHINVYSEPSVTIEQLISEFDLRKTAPTLGPTDQTGQPVTETTVSDAKAVASIEVESNTTDSSLTAVSICKVTNAYPKPREIQFIQFPDHRIIASNQSTVSFVRNNDGTYNASATLNMEVTQDLNRATILCRVVLTELFTYKSDESPPYNVLYDTNEVRVHFSNPLVKVGDILNISCLANGNPPPRTMLRLPNGKDMPNDADSVVRITRDDAGLYTCTAHLHDGRTLTDTKTLIVRWLEQPVLTGVPTNKHLQLGEKLNVSCEAEGSPPPTYSWSKNGVKINSSGGGKLSIDSVQLDDSGTYKCAAHGVETRYASFNLSVTTGCSVTITKATPSSAKKSEESIVKLTCTSVGNPECSVAIYDSKRSNPLATKSKEVEYYHKSLPEKTKNKEYWCKAENRLSTKWVKMNLDTHATSGSLGTQLIISKKSISVPLAVFAVLKFFLV